MEALKERRSSSETNEETGLLQDDDLTVGSKEKHIRTAHLFAVYFIMGLNFEIISPTMPELAIQTGSDYSMMTKALSLRGYGHAVGGIFSGLLVDRFMHQVDLSAFVLLCCYSTAGFCVAYSQTVTYLFFAYFIQGCIDTCISTISCRLLLTIWKEKAASKVIGAYIGACFGGLLVPILAASFLDPRFSNSAHVSHFNSTCNSGSEDETNRSSDSASQLIPLYPARFVMAYWIVAILSFIVTIMFLLFHFHSRLSAKTMAAQNSEKREEGVSFREAVSLRRCSPKHPWLAVGLILGLTLYRGFMLPITADFAKFIFLAARDAYCLSPAVAASTVTVYYIGYGTGRVAASLMAHIVHMKYIMQAMGFSILTVSLLLLHLHRYEAAFWVLMFLFGVATGPLKPSMASWANRYIEFTSAAQILPEVGGSVGQAAAYIYFGHSYDDRGPESLWATIVFLASGVLVSIVIMQSFGSLMGDRFVNKDLEEEK